MEIIMLDCRNAFNTASWDLMAEELKKKESTSVSLRCSGKVPRQLGNSGEQEIEKRNDKSPTGIILEYTL